MYAKLKPNSFDKMFDIFVIVIIALTSIVCLLPMINLAAVSLSGNQAIINSEVFLLPVDFTIQTYKDIFSDKSMMTSLGYTAFLTISYTLLSMALTILAAYPLSKSRLRGRKFFMIIIIITMYFSGGLIPDYLLIRDLNMLDSTWSLLLPGALSAFNLIILKSFFQTLPESLEEAAQIDGCGEFSILVKIILPLSLPILATLCLFYAVAKWNSFMDALFYITDPKLQPIQLKLYQIIANSQSIESAVAEGNMTKDNSLPESLKAACVMFASLPIISIYPWLQKYFIKGVMVGAVKG